MRRRELITGLGSVAVWPLLARAQPAERVRRIGGPRRGGFGHLTGRGSSKPAGLASCGDSVAVRPEGDPVPLQPAPR
jgi:hypothetical protein